MTTERNPGFATLAVHAGAQPDPTTGARATPIYQTTSFVFDDVDHAASLFGLQAFGNIYTRIGNPTNAVLEERVAALEGGTAALAVASGHAAQFLVFHTMMQPGDEFIASKKLYGGSINQFNHSYKSFDWQVRWADPDDLSTFEKARHAEDQGDLHRIDRQSRRRHHRHRGRRGDRQEGRRAADRRQHACHALSLPARSSTAPTSSCIRSPNSSAAMAIRSAASSSTAASSTGWRPGATRCCRRPARNMAASCSARPSAISPSPSRPACSACAISGPALSPFNAFLILTGIETLPLRMQRHSDNALDRRRATSPTTRRSPGSSYPGPARRPLPQPRQEILPQGRRRGLHLRPQGRLRGGRQARLRGQAVLASRQCRRYALADHPPRLDDASPALRRAAASRRAPVPRWCGSRSASRMRRTSSPISTRR